MKALYYILYNMTIELPLKNQHRTLQAASTPIIERHKC